MGNEALRDALQYTPEQAYTDREGTNRVYDEMWTADWWWDTQVSNTVFRISREELTSVIIRKNYSLVQLLHQSSSPPIKPSFHTSEEIKAPGQYT